MAQQSNHETRPTETSHQGARTREHQRDERSKSLNQTRQDSEQPAGEFETEHDEQRPDGSAH